jgi:pyruvate kinase
MKDVKVMVTLGPATSTKEDLRKIKDKGVDFVRINMSHSSINDLKRYIKMSKEIGIPFIIDTEGSQVRTGNLTTNTIELEENDEIKIYQHEVAGNKEQIYLKPKEIMPQLSVGDLIHVDFDTVSLRISNISTKNEGFLTAKVVTGGTIGKNKAVVVDLVSQKKLHLPTLSEKDLQSIQVGLEESIGHIAASFIRSGKAVQEVRQATQNTMQIISKVECIDALENLDDIIKHSDYILIDRGDLSKEIPIEKVPFTQKIILHRSNKQNTGVFVATNFLETMITQKKPTRAEVHDIINSIVDGAYGLTLAAETAIGKYPLSCINMMNKVIKHSQLANVSEFKDKENDFVRKLEESNYLLDFDMSSSLIAPHGGKLINRMSEPHNLDLPQIRINENTQRDVEQIAIGTYSPLTGFMGEQDFISVLDSMKLANGTIWPLPIILDVSEEEAANLRIGQDVALHDGKEVMATLHLEEKYSFNKSEMAMKMFSTNDMQHPGVKSVMNMQPILLGGKINVFKRMESKHKEYEITPRQARNLFEERGWAKVVGFHTRNVIHKGHEFIQMEALRRENCDGLFVHPVVGKKKTGDYNASQIIKSYELMNQFYPKNTVFFGTFSTYSRYAGPREALFTALCRKNFGCSHFIVGRDHTGVGNYYHPKASHNIFDRFDIGIKAICFDKVFYSEQHGHMEENPNVVVSEEEKLHVSGTEARKLLESGKLPPTWFMRPEISQMIINAIVQGEEVFVKEFPPLIS